jgi:hypothetical protein
VERLFHGQVMTKPRRGLDAHTLTHCELSAMPHSGK